MNGLKPFRFVPEDITQWTRWANDQDIPDPVSDTILRGSVTFIGITPRTVSFSTDETSVNYAILVDASVNETFWTTGKTLSGFQLNSSNATSTASIEWVLVR